MLCPVCKVEMRIKSSGHVLKKEGEIERLYMKQDLACRNPNCTNHEKVVKTIYNELSVSRE